jgi:hypothetical protein
MSDWLLQGVDPRDPAGKEIFFHTAEEWFDIVGFVDFQLYPLFPLANDNPLGWLEDRDCLELAKHIDSVLESGVAAKFLKGNKDFSGPDSLTLDNLRRFSSFLKSCGGFMADVSYG